MRVTGCLILSRLGRSVQSAAQVPGGGEIACYLDGGVCDGVPSTVVAIDEAGALRVIRAGAVALNP